MRTRNTYFWTMFAALLLNASICQNLRAETCRIGIVADVHVRDSNRAQLRDWGQVKQWLEEFFDRMEAWKADFNIELGDLNDGHVANHALGDGHEDRVSKGMAVRKTSMAAERSHKVPGYSVMGNHEVQNGRTHGAMAELKGMPGHYYSFDKKGYHFVVLDTNYSAGPHTKAFKIPADQVAWLKQDLAGSSNTTVVFLHVPIDTYFGVGGTRPDLQKEYNSVENEAEIRKILEDDGDVVLVVEGHAHSGPGPEANEPKETVTNGIRYWYVPSFNASVFCHAKLTLTENKCSIEFANNPEGVNAASERGAIFKMPSYSFDLKLPAGTEPTLTPQRGASLPASKPALNVSSAFVLEPAEVVPPSPGDDPAGIKHKTKWFPGQYSKTERACGPGYTGWRVNVNWRQCEPEPGKYDFSMIESSLNRAQAQGKKVIIHFAILGYFGPAGTAPDWAKNQGVVYPGHFADGRKFGVLKVWEPWVNSKLLALWEAMRERVENHPALAMFVMCESLMVPQPDPGFSTDHTPEKMRTEWFRWCDHFNTWVHTPCVFTMTWGSAKYKEQMSQYAINKRIGVRGPDLRTPAHDGALVPDITTWKHAWKDYQGQAVYQIMVSRPSTTCYISPQQAYDDAVKLGIHFLDWVDSPKGWTAAQQRAFVQSKAHLPACGMNEERPSMWPKYR